MKINIEREINAPADVLWSFLADYANIHRFHPLLKGSEFVDGTNSCGVGSTRQCDMKDGNYVKERITAWEPGSHYTVEIYETSMPVKNATATIGVTPLSDQKTRAFMQMEMTPKYKLMQPLLYLMFRFFAGPSILRGLEKVYQKEHALGLI